ncbi:MAG: ABC transporter substrate-binding protein [Richelia sp. SL_2_1]|nr:ABC transporter substrate-binding protein [Richelia sp. SM1_7_0]NJN10219.1 ABC transporter substrate-binding protein [Richelia sp. RM1_1_1]NJO28645.1 ABC transporter substrate-binding protein [Richelia sp. SL_2_1]
MKRFFTLLIISLSLSLWIASCNTNSISSGGGDIIVASKNFTEQDILGELLAQQIEATTQLKVDRRPQLGGSFICHKAIVAGEIDAYIEYTGTALTAILEQKVISDSTKVYNLVKQAYDKQFNLEVTKPLGFENTFAMIIRGEDAKKYNIKTLSEAAKYTPSWRAGFGYEFGEREDGFPGLSKAYNLKFGESPKIMDLGLIYRALTQKLVDMVAGNSTDGQIARLGLVVLEDDKNYFPPYEAAPIVRQDTLKKYPQLQKPLTQLAGILTADEMQQLNYQVEGELRDIKEVVSEFRQSKGL